MILTSDPIPEVPTIPPTYLTHTEPAPLLGFNDEWWIVEAVSPESFHGLLIFEDTRPKLFLTDEEVQGLLSYLASQPFYHPLLTNAIERDAK